MACAGRQRASKIPRADCACHLSTSRAGASLAHCRPCAPSCTAAHSKLSTPGCASCKCRRIHPGPRVHDQWSCPWQCPRRRRRLQHQHYERRLSGREHAARVRATAPATSSLMRPRHSRKADARVKAAPANRSQLLWLWRLLPHRRRSRRGGSMVAGAAGVAEPPSRTPLRRRTTTIQASTVCGVGVGGRASRSSSNLSKPRRRSIAFPQRCRHSLRASDRISRHLEVQPTWSPGGPCISPVEAQVLVRRAGRTLCTSASRARGSNPCPRWRVPST